MTDWYDRRHELRVDQVFREQSGLIVKLDRTVPGDGSDWYVLEWHNGWFAYDRRIHPSDLAERLPDEPTKSDPRYHPYRV